MPNNYKLFSDPVHGFISVPKGLVMALVQQPEVQRLRRIRQLGVGHLVFPGAEHTRFNHALGAMALMQDALAVIEGKGTRVSPTERTAALAAALLHDVGHGPYSHTLEHYLIRNFRHEQMSRRLLVRLIDRLAGHPQHDALTLALKIFDGTYERAFFHRLVASQLDMDRLDYLRRDAFYTGVAEGEVGVERLLKTLRVVPSGDEHASRDATQVAVEAKGIYAVENFLISRRLMYWQVYLHKTVLAGDELLRAAFRRVRWHFREGRGALAEGCSPALCFFLQNDLSAEALRERPAVTDHYTALDDTDVLFSLKQWQHADDPVLADLARRFIDRDFFRVTFLPERPTEAQLADWRTQVAGWLKEKGLARDRSSESSFEEAARYYLTLGRSRHSAYQRERGEAIGILGRDGQVRELSEVADTAALTALSERVTKPYLCYPKAVNLDLSMAPAGSA